MRLLTSLVFLIVVAAAGCVGDVGPDPGDDDGSGSGSGSGDTQTAKALFKADVYPVVAKCSGAGCHDQGATSAAASKFYGPSADTTYDTAVGQSTLVGTFQATAPILQKIVAEAHKGMSYTADEQTKITAWLAKETTERMGKEPPFDAQAALKTWSGCMSVANFTAANMTAAWSNLGADDLRKCLSCHQAALGNFLILNNTQAYFDQLTQHSTLLLKYFTVDNTAKKVVVNIASQKSAAVNNTHPSFNPTVNAGMVALQKLYDLTVARQTANGCDPGRLVD